MAHGPSCSVACGMWDLPRPGLEPVSPALAGRFSTTAPPGKPYFLSLNQLVQKETEQGVAAFDPGVSPVNKFIHTIVLGQQRFPY